MDCLALRSSENNISWHDRYDVDSRRSHVIVSKFVAAAYRRCTRSVLAATAPEFDRAVVATAARNWPDAISPLPSGVGRTAISPLPSGPGLAEVSPVPPDDIIQHRGKNRAG